jgi:hypothetical protein
VERKEPTKGQLMGKLAEASADKEIFWGRKNPSLVGLFMVMEISVNNSV